MFLCDSCGHFFVRQDSVLLLSIDFDDNSLLVRKEDDSRHEIVLS